MVEAYSESSKSSQRSISTAVVVRQPKAICTQSAMVVAAAPAHPNPITILRLPDVMNRVGLKHAAIYQRIAQGSFPRQISLGNRAVGWLEHEIDAWIAARISMTRCLPDVGQASTSQISRPKKARQIECRKEAD